MPDAKDDVYLRDATELFSVTLANLMNESGMTKDVYTDAEIADVIRTCVTEGYASIWEEFLSWVMYGDDKKEMTRAMLRLGRSMWRM